MWFQIALFVLSIVVSTALMPKPKRPDPLGLDDVNAPTADPGRLIPIVFGTVVIKSSNTVWYGDLDYQEIKK